MRSKILTRTRIALAATLAAALCGTSLPASAAVSLFTFDELEQLYAVDTPPAELAAKLDTLLSTPFVDNSASSAGVQPVRPEIAGPERGLRVAMWNIERGLEYQAIVGAFRGPSAFQTFINSSEYPQGSAERTALTKEVALLQSADIVVLNEVDWGVPRSGYRNIAGDLGAALKMNWAYGVEFVEVDPLTMGTETFEEIEDPAKREEFVANLPRVDRRRMKGMHGTAILSRYPLENVRIVRFGNQGHDWYADEKKGVSEVESGKRKASEVAFLEKITREVRRGNRMFMLADVSDPLIPGGKATIVAAHLEARTKPETRVAQLEEILLAIRDIPHPVILAGDMNTTSSDSTPTSIKREITKRLGSTSFWAKEGIKAATGVGLVVTAPISAYGYFKKYRDPTARSIPLFAENKEAKFFKTLEDFRFTDTGRFDFRGESARSSNGRSGTLANSNERASKGFASTFKLEQTYGPTGKLKLDWIFVKPPVSADGRNESYRFAPHYGRTLTRLNYAGANRISDHCPILVDLPFAEPAVQPAPAQKKRRLPFIHGN